MKLGPLHKRSLTRKNFTFDNILLCTTLQNYLTGTLDHLNIYEGEEIMIQP